VTGPATDFATLPLSPETLANLTQLGYLQMTPIQAAGLPVALLGKDLIAQAKTGSGKTAAFALALLANLNPRRFAVQAMVLCPTRELADQVTTEIRRLARGADNIKVVTLCGGVALRGQLASLEHGAHIVVGTPGRIMDHLDRGSLNLEASTRWCSTKPIACSTWASSTTSPRSRACVPRSGRPCCSRPRTPRASPGSARSS
jgi:ATP-independent RNA helicase DbpA